MNSRHRYAGQYAPESSRLYEDRDLFWIVPFRVQYIVGVVGRRFAGKSSALTYLREKRGFRVYSMASIVRDNALSIGLPLEPRSHLQDLGDDLRAGSNDGGFLAREVLRRIRLEQLAHRTSRAPVKVAVGGFKHPDEITKVFALTRRFRLIRIDASDDARFRRAVEDGTLARELAGIPGSPEPSRQAFDQYLDERDRKGIVARRPWTEKFGQAVDATLEAVHDPLVVENEPAWFDTNGSPATEGAPDMQDNFNTLYSQLEDHVRKLDGRFRTGSFGS